MIKFKIWTSFLVKIFKLSTINAFLILCLAAVADAATTGDRLECSPRASLLQNFMYPLASKRQR